jgi:hypothetical protein
MNLLLDKRMQVLEHICGICIVSRICIFHSGKCKIWKSWGTGKRKTANNFFMKVSVTLFKKIKLV